MDPAELDAKTIGDLPPQVYLVDDHQVELDLMRRWCLRGGWASVVFDDPYRFLEQLPAQPLGCVVADLRMPMLSGLDLLAELRRRDVMLPMILVTGYGDAENCRHAFRQGVFDFIEKGFDAAMFIEVIERAVNKNRHDQLQRHVRLQARQSLQSLSPREHEVALLLGSGASLKSISAELQISVQTASKHRGSIFQKLNIQNEIELYKTLLTAECNLDSNRPC